MKHNKTILAGLAAVAISSVSFGGANESASLSATVGAGALEIVASSISGTHSPTSGAITATDSIQTGAVTFAIDGITINDLNGDSLGWTLTASAGNLTNGASTMTPSTTYTGFNTFSDAGNTTAVSADEIDYTDTSGVAGYTTDYDISYDVPAYPEAGTYTGTIAYSIVAN